MRPWEQGYTPPSPTVLTMPQVSPQMTMEDVLAEPTRWGRAKALAWLWATERTTWVGLLHVAALLTGWAIMPTKIEVLASLLFVTANSYLIVFKEKRK